MGADKAKNIAKVWINEIKLNPNNPRIIKDDKFHKLVESVKSFPGMLEIRPIVVNKDMIILGGNMRYKEVIEKFNLDPLNLEWLIEAISFLYERNNKLEEMVEFNATNGFLLL